LHVVFVVLPQVVDHHVGEMRARRGAEAGEGREECVVLGRHVDGRQVGAHGESVDQAVVELLIAQRLGNEHVTRLVAAGAGLHHVRPVRA